MRPVSKRDSRFSGLTERTAAAAARLRRLRTHPYATPALLVGLFAALAALPLTLETRVLGVTPESVLSLNLLVVTLLWATAAQSWNVVSGFAGQFSFGHAAFFGLGAYVPLVLAREFGVSPWVGLLAGATAAAAYALCLGVLSFRYEISGGYFVLITLAFSQLLFYVFTNVDFLGGASGLVKPLPDAYGTEFGLAAFQFSSTEPYYYIILSFLVVVTAVALSIRRSRVGLYLHAIRDDEAAASTVGIPRFRYKLFALVVSAFFTAWPGTFWAMYFTSIRPAVVFGVPVNLDILLPAAIGGIGTVFGPIVGSFALTLISEAGRQAVGIPELQDIIGGLVLLVVVLKSPGGLVSWPSRLVALIDRFRGW